MNRTNHVVQSVLSAMLLQEADAVVATGAPAAAPVVITTEPRDTDFHFKKEKIKNEKGDVIGEGKKHPSIKVPLPIPNADGILEIVQAGGKPLELLLDAASAVVYEQARQQINNLREANKEQEIKPEMIDLSKLDWSYIASLPPSERRGLGISEEDWDDFFADYRAIMPKALNKDADRIEKHVQLYKSRLNRVRNDKKALAVLRDALTIYAATTSQMEENQTVYEYLSKRVDTLLQEEEKVLAEAL